MLVVDSFTTDFDIRVWYNLGTYVAPCIGQLDIRQSLLVIYRHFIKSIQACSFSTIKSQVIALPDKASPPAGESKLFSIAAARLISGRFLRTTCVHETHARFTDVRTGSRFVCLLAYECI